MNDTSGSELPDPTHYGPWAVIAGGSEGVGAGFAQLLAEAGINLVLVARNPEPLEQTADVCRRHGVEVRAVAADLTADPDSVFAATADLEVGLYIHNAGANTHSHEFLDGSAEDFQNVIDLNITAPLRLIRHFGTPMRDRQRGGILLVGSLTGYVGSVRHTIYGGTKAFSRVFAESLWLELREHGVHVLELVLGVTRTPAMQRVGLDFDAAGVPVSDPVDVAREGLRHLADGPVRVAGDNAAVAAAHSAPDRTDVVLRTHHGMKRLMGLD